MVDNQIIGRSSELDSLKRVYHSSEAEFVAVYGRRRVGKTYLIRNFLEQNNALSFQLTGIHNASLKIQLAEFMKELEALYKKLHIKVQLQLTSSWFEAFEALTEALKLAQGNVVLFFDEFPWMATKKSRLLQALDYYWNRYWVNNPKIKLIICGSAASWIIENILNNKGGLHNRITLRLPIEPFTLSETKQYLNSRNVILNQDQIIQLYLCIGGIPFYLRFIEKGLSTTQNINHLCFEKSGMLINEFNNLFSSLFKHAETHEKIVRLLAKKRQGIKRTEIVKHLNINGGTLTRLLNELEYAGFIEKFIPWQYKNNYFYKLIDEYSLFYLHWIAPTRRKNQLHALNDEFWQTASQSSAWKAWSGYAFEAICFKHIDNIKQALNIPKGATASTWSYTPKSGSHKHGAQIDLLFERPDGLINLCEIKYNNTAFRIDKDYAEKLRNKIETYKQVTKTNKQICLSMITAHGLADSIYREGLVWSETTANDLFQ